MKYTMELTADEARALEETMRLVRKGGDARLVARSKAGASLARKVEELRGPPSRFAAPRVPTGREVAGLVENAPRATTFQWAMLPPPLPSTPVVAPTTLASESPSE